MVEGLGAFDPAALVILMVALIGLVPIAAYYRDETRVFVAAYGCLVVAAIATNFENVVLPDLLNVTEHVVGILGSGVMFAVAAYLRRRAVVSSDDDAGTGALEG